MTDSKSSIEDYSYKELDELWLSVFGFYYTDEEMRSWEEYDTK